MTPSPLRLGGLFALGFIALTLTATFLPHEALPLQPPEDGQEVRAFFERNAAMQAVQPLTKLLGAFLFLGFAAVVSRALRTAGAPLEASLALAGGALFAGILVAIMVIVASIVTLATTLDGSHVYSLYNVAWIANVRAGVVAAPFLVATGVGVLRTRALPRWTGYAALVAATLAVGGACASLVLPGPASIGPAFLGFVAVLAWTLAAGVTMLSWRARPTHVGPATSPDAR